MKRMTSYRDLETKKSLHVNLTRETHAALRIVSFQYHLSMQEIFEELACQIVEGQPYMIEVLNEMSDRKKRKASKKMSRTDAESLFRAIEADNPLNNKLSKPDSEE